LSARLERRVQAGRVGARQIRRPEKPERRWGGKSSTEATLVHCLEKPLTRPGRCPYRKPTQVGGVSILRRAREPSLRNSAK